MLVLPYGLAEAPRRARPVTLVVAGAWLIAAVIAVAHDAPLERERRRLCEEAAIQILRFPSVALDAPGWPGCPLEEYARRASTLQVTTPVAADHVALTAAIRERARRAHALAGERLSSRLAYRPQTPTWHGPLTAALLFSSPLALLPALLCLLVAGAALERRRGAWLLVTLLVVGSVAGVLSLGAGLPSASATSVPGAAGGIAALAGLSLAVAPRGRVRLFWCFWWFRWGRLSAPVLLVVPLLGLSHLLFHSKR